MPCTPKTQRVVSSQRWEGLPEISGGGEPESHERDVGTRSSEQPQGKWRPERLSPHSALPPLCLPAISQEMWLSLDTVLRI